MQTKILCYVIPCTDMKVLMDEVKIEQDVKYEGIEFVDITREGLE